MPTPGLSKNIRVPLINGKDYTIQELHSMVLASKISGKKLYTYGIDDWGDIEVTEILDSVRGGKEEIWRVALLSGERIEGVIASETFILLPDDWNQSNLRSHRYETEVAEKLVNGDKLYPLSRFEDEDGYEAVVQQATRTIASTHWLADNFNIRQETIDDIPSDLWHRRHKDGNRRNNDPENILRLTPTEANIKKPTVPSLLALQQKSYKTNNIANIPKNDPNYFSMLSKLKDAEPNYYEHDNAYYESRERWKRKQRKPEDKYREAFEKEFIVDFTELMIEIIEEEEVPIKDVVYTLVTDLGNFAIAPGVFVLC